MLLRMLLREHSEIRSTFIKLLLFIKIFVLSIFELPLKTGFTVLLLTLFVDACLVHVWCPGVGGGVLSFFLHT